MHMLPTKDQLQIKRLTGHKGMGNNSMHMETKKKNWGSNIYIRKKQTLKKAITRDKE